MPTANKIPFKTAYGEREHHYIPTGNGTEEIWEYEINKYGQKVLVKTGEYSLYNQIQESLEETKIENILKRVAAGDDSVMRPDGIYGDITEAPKNLIEARQQMQKLENLWNGLDNEIKKKYDFDVEKFIGSSGSESWLKDMGLLPVTENESPAAAEVKAEGATNE